MEVIRGFHNLRSDQRGCVLTIGNFDGIHRGHQALIARTRELAREHALPSTVLTFEPTPREFFAGKDFPGRITLLRDRLHLLEALGVERVLLAGFDRRLSAVSANTFVDVLLVARLGVKAVVIGDDFRFGSKRAGDVQLLREQGARQGFSAEGLATVTAGGERCSSTAVRTALATADLPQAARLLGRAYCITGRVRRGLQLGRQLDMPTANIPLKRRMALKLGIYGVRARLGGRIWKGVANLGVRPTLGTTPCLLETHLFESPGDIYGQLMEVEFVHFLRPEQKFDSLEALKTQMHLDKKRAQSLLALTPPPALPVVPPSPAGAGEGRMNRFAINMVKP